MIFSVCCNLDGVNMVRSNHQISHAIVKPYCIVKPSQPLIGLIKIRNVLNIRRLFIIHCWGWGEGDFDFWLLKFNIPNSFVEKFAPLQWFWWKSYAAKSLPPEVNYESYLRNVGISLIFTKSIIQHKFYIDICIEITQKISIFSQAEI